MATLLTGCGPQTPWRIGFIGSLSDRGAELGEAGRNGLILAVEQRNKAGGIDGRPVELVIQDDGQSADSAATAMRALLAARVEAVVGPFTSAMAAAVVPIADQAHMLVISPTVTSADFVGRDDHFIRVNRTTRDNAVDYAGRLAGRGQRRVAIAYDLRNRSFSESWLAEFRTAMTARGGSVAIAVPFESGSDVGFSDILRRLIAADPDGLLFIAQAVDVARLAQQATRLAPALPKSSSEWAAGETLIELGGRSVEGLLIAQAHNRDDRSARYLEFRNAYQARFGREPGFAAINTHDAAAVLFEAMARRERNETLKDAIVRIGSFDGLQQRMRFDRFGDSARAVFFTEVRGGRFVLVD